MKSYFNNGGYIGTTVDIGNTLQYQTGTGQERANLIYVGGQTTSFGGDNTTTNITFNLNGGTDTTPQANDLVVVVYGVGTGGSRNPTLNITTGYTSAFTQLFQSDTNASTKMGVWYKRMGSTPDTQFTRTGTGSSLDGGAIAVHVWRNVDATTPMDATPTTSQSNTTGLPDPPAITPVTTKAVILAVGASGHTDGTDTFTAGYLSNFRTVGVSDDFDITVGIGSVDWTGGTYDPAAWTSSVGTPANFGNIAATLALRPALVDIPLYGNKKNSGIWNLNTVYDDRIYNTPVDSEAAYLGTPAGTYYFVVPPGLTEVSAVCVGGGGGGGGGEAGRNEGVSGGGGGGLAWGTFNVIPNEILTIVVGAGGTGGTTGTDGNPGGASQILRGATVLLQGGGGGAGIERSTATVQGGTSTGTARQGGGSGGNSGGNSTDTGSGGGGAGGYSGNGGNGGTTGAGSSGVGGGGGGGGATNSGQGYGGGGTSLYGEGTSGAGGALNNSGFGGSLGDDGTRPNGGYPGGGGGACDDDTNGSGGNGADGAVFIIWGNNRTYPNNTGLL